MVLTAKRAAEICREWYVAFRNKGKGEEKCVLELLDAADTIEALEAAQPKWISVDERLPDEPGEVLACVYGRICIAWYSNRCFETPSGMVFYPCENAVTHWMPLPETPKEDA